MDTKTFNIESIRATVPWEDTGVPGGFRKSSIKDCNRTQAIGPIMETFITLSAALLGVDWEKSSFLVLKHMYSDQDLNA